MATKIGKIFRRMRIEKDEYLKNMAHNLGISSAYLSSIENGKRRLTPQLIDRIRKVYSLTQDEVENLRIATMESQREVSVNIAEASDDKKYLALAFARGFDGISEEQLRKIRNILEED